MTSDTIAEVLGGKKTLGRSIKTFSDLAELIRKGLPSGSLIVLGERLDLKNAALSEKLGIPQRTLTRRLSRHSRLTAAESDRTVRLARVYATAVEMIGNAGLRPRSGSAPPTVPSEAGFRSINWILTWGREKWKTFSGASPTAFTANASVEDLPRHPRRRSFRRRVRASSAAAGIVREYAWFTVPLRWLLRRLRPLFTWNQTCGPTTWSRLRRSCPRLSSLRIRPASLPRNWDEMRDDSRRKYGDRWIRAGKEVALHVPSAAIRGEWNVLINPGHADFCELKIGKPKPFEFDLRMFR